MKFIIMDLDDYFISKREEYIMDSFRFQNGEVLNNAVVEYMTFGTPKYDDNPNCEDAYGLVEEAKRIHFYQKDLQNTMITDVLIMLLYTVTVL